MAQLPAPLAIAGPQEKLAYIHEYVHYVQAVTTFYGANRLHCFLKSLKLLQSILKANGGNVANLDRQAFGETCLGIARDLTYVTSDAPTGEDASTLKLSLQLDGLQMLSHGEERMLAYCRPLTGAASWVFPVGAMAIQESQAMAVERWFDMASTSSLYSEAANSDNDAFQYAVVSESLRKSFRWHEPSILLITVILCDIALNDYLPRRILPLAIDWLKRNWAEHWEPKLEDLPEIYKSIADATYSEQVEIERGKLFGELQRAIDRAATGDTEADLILSRMFKLYLQGHDLRKKVPHTFVKLLLEPESELTRDLKVFAALPIYHTSRGLHTTSDDENLIRSCLVFLALSHFVHYLAGIVNETKSTPECPFLHRPDHCDWLRTPRCTNTPWLKEDHNGQGCVYRFAADSIGAKVPIKPTQDA